MLNHSYLLVVPTKITMHRQVDFIFETEAHQCLQSETIVETRIRQEICKSSSFTRVFFTAESFQIASHQSVCFMLLFLITELNMHHIIKERIRVHETVKPNKQ